MRTKTYVDQKFPGLVVRLSRLLESGASLLAQRGVREGRTGPVPGELVFKDAFLVHCLFVRVVVTVVAGGVAKLHVLLPIFLALGPGFAVGGAGVNEPRDGTVDGLSEVPALMKRGGGFQGQ